MTQASAAPLAIETEGLGRRYGRRWALVDASLRVVAGRVVMLAGRNGSGKSTLLRVLATAIRADRGNARVAGYDIATDRHEVRRRIALLAHQLHLYEPLTPVENLAIAAGFLDAEARAALDATLQEVGLFERRNDPVATFSAGMRKRLALALVLLQRPSVVFLDEPYGQLDPPGFALIDHLLDRFRRQGATVLMATHLLERGAERCDDALVLETGRVVYAGPAAALSDRELPTHATEEA